MIMKNKIKWIIIQLVVVFVFGSCSDDFFNEKPSDRISPDQHYNSNIDAEISCLASLAILQNVVPQMVFASDLLSDATIITKNANLNWQDINNHNLSANNPYLDPSVFYQVIINANESLMNIDSIRNRDKDITEIDLNIYKGNLIGIRSWSYFTIARLYGEVAYIPDNLSQLPENLEYIPREAILDTLVNNLLPYLDIDYLDYWNLSMYNKALIGEIYLEKQDYQNAITYLQMAIEGFENTKSIFKVTKDYSRDSWKDFFINSSGHQTEVMIAVPFSFTEKQPNPIEKWYGYNDEYIAKPSNNILDLFAKQKAIKGDDGDKYRGLGISFDTINSSNYVVNKYNLNRGVLYSSDIILYRAADIHLLLAEAFNRGGSSDIALDILNEGYHDFRNWNQGVGIRGRVYLQNIEIPEEVDKVKYLEDIIIEERAMELAFEGKRWFDLMRVARRRDNSYLADKVAAKYPDANMANKVRDKLNNEANWYLPFKK